MKNRETERLILRAFKEDDFAAVHSYASSRENTKYMLFGPNKAEDTHAFIGRAIAHASKVPIVNYTFAAELKDTGALIGACDLHLRDNNDSEVGWILHKDHWGKGYGTEMGRELLKLGFEEHSLHRIIAVCDEQNTASSRVMEKIGMRREGLFYDCRPTRKGSAKPYRDELYYAILKEEWEAQNEIAYYNTLPCSFTEHIDLPTLSDGELHLVCMEKYQANPEKKHVPAYNFAICKGSEKIGTIGLRIGYTDDLYYSGQIGYETDEPYRGKGYAAQACRLLVPIARVHGMTKLLITNNHTNIASMRVCEKLSTRLLRTARLPEWASLYKEGQRFVNIYEWEL